MTKKLVQHGENAAIIIDKPILDLLNVGMDTALEISTDGRDIVISPVASHSEDEFLESPESRDETVRRRVRANRKPESHTLLML